MRIPAPYLAAYLSAVALLLVLLSISFIRSDRQIAARAARNAYRGRRRLAEGIEHQSLSCGCRDNGGAIYECLYCDKTGCAKHRIPPHECLPDRLSQEATSDA